MHSLHGYEPKVGMNADHPPACRNQPGIGFITVQPYTADQFRRRIERAFRAVEFGYSNPFRAVIQERLEQSNAEHRREVDECKAEGGNPF